MIRYRRSPNHKLYPLEIGMTQRVISATPEKSKLSDSGGSMVASLKLKGIDGRTPPGVEPVA